MKMSLWRLLVLPFLILTACEDENETTPTEVGIAIPNISVTCTSGDAVSCLDANTGTEMLFGWTAGSCDDVGSNTVLYAETDMDQFSIVCQGGTCSQESDTGVWLTNGNVAEYIPASATTAVVWINFGDSGVNDGNGPSGGDVICCLDNQTGDAEIPSSACIQL